MLYTAATDTESPSECDDIADHVNTEVNMSLHRRYYRLYQSECLVNNYLVNKAIYISQILPAKYTQVLRHIFSVWITLMLNVITVIWLLFTSRNRFGFQHCEHDDYSCW